MKAIKPFLIVAVVLALWRTDLPAYGFTYTFTTIAGNPAILYSYADGSNSNALFNGPSGVAVDSSGNLYVADQLNYVIRQARHVGINWIVTTIAGTPGQFNFSPPIVNGTNGHALFNFPTGLVVDSQGNVYVADQDNDAIRKITPVAGTTNWVTTTIAGNGSLGHADGANGSATFGGPTGVAIDANSNLFVADQYNDTIRKITPVAGTTNWVVTTIAGLTGNQGHADGVGTNASFKSPTGVAVDAAGNVYVADEYNNTIRKITPVAGTTNWSVSTIAGNPLKSGSSDGTNNAALFDLPSGVALDMNGNLFVADQDNDTIRKIVPVGTNWAVSTIGGLPGTKGSTDGASTNALFYYPFGLATDTAGNVYVADTGNDTLRLGSPPPAPQLTRTTGTSQYFQFVLNAQPGATCVVQASSDLLTWSSLSTNTIPSDGSLPLTYLTTGASSPRFYRAILP